MKSIKKIMLAASLLAVSTTSLAATTSVDGTLGNDPEGAAGFLFIISEASYFTAESFSYAGGTQFDGDVHLAGGFDPILTLFNNATGDFIVQNDDGAGAIADTTSFNEAAGTSTGTGASFDAFIERIAIAAGSYLVTITQFSNFAVGPKLADGFDGSGFTTFMDVTGDPRTDSFAYDITLSAVPVPAAGILFASALLGAGALGRRKKKATKSNMIGAFARAA